MVERQPLQQVALAVLLLWALTAQLTYSGYLVYLQVNASRFAHVPFLTEPYSAKIQAVPDAYENSGLHAGDRIVAVDGKPVRGERLLDAIRFDHQPGEVLNLTVERSLGARQSRLNLAVRLTGSVPQWTRTLVLSVFLPLSCILIGFYIAFARPRDPVAWITMAMLASFGQVVGTGIFWLFPSPLQELLIFYHATLSNSWPLWLALFALYFPVPFAWWKKHDWLNWVLAAPCIVLACLGIYGYLEAGEHFDRLGALSAFAYRTEPIVNLVFTVYVFAFFIVMTVKRSVLQASDAKRRLIIMQWGCSAALLPLLPVVFLNLPVWLNTLCLLMLVFFPLTMAYVIVVQRAMDIRMVVRSGVRYAFATNGIQILRVVLVTALVVVTVELEQQSAHRWEGILIAAAGVFLVVAVGRLASRLRRWMDRRFFREALNAELILTELGNTVAGIRDIRTLLQTVTRRISDSLHVEQIAVLLEKESIYEPAHALGFDTSAPPLAIASATATIRLLKQARSPSRVYFDDPQSWVYGTSETEQNLLLRLRAQILLPLSLNGRLLGLISLGPKKSEIPYSQADLQLLNAVASQTGLALENAELTDSIRKEIAQRERLNRELEIARDVQQHLFPQILPQVSGIDFAGYCRPAESVGGDYYDFVRLPDNCLGIAIGDVSGKGIAAALMMASLQASLRGQTIKPCSTLSEMIGHINRLMHDASAENRYATFFYAQYEAATRVLRYVNAGHNAPIVYRRRDGTHEVIRLEDGGTVVGLFPDFPFREAKVVLESGDVFIGFTDGISEAMNKGDEEFEEKRLLNALQDHQARTAADLISEILEKVDSFTAGARQHDDMTLVILRVA